MSTEDEEANRHRTIGLGKHGMLSREELLQSNEVPERFAHLLPTDSNHIIVHPVAYHSLSVL